MNRPALPLSSLSASDEAARVAAATERAWWATTARCDWGPAGPVGECCYRTRADAERGMRVFGRWRGIPDLDGVSVRSGPRHAARAWAGDPLPPWGDPSTGLPRGEARRTPKKRLAAEAGLQENALVNVVRHGGHTTTRTLDGWPPRSRWT